MRTTIKVVSAVLLALAGISVFAEGGLVGVRINGDDLTDTEMYWNEKYNNNILVHYDTFNMVGTNEYKEVTWSLAENAASTSSGIIAYGSTNREVVLTFTTDEDVVYQGKISASVQDRDLRLIFDSFVAGGEMFDFDTPYFSSTGTVIYAFSSNARILPRDMVNDVGLDVLRYLAEETGVKLEFSIGSRFSFDVTPYLPAGMCAVKLLDDDGLDFWEVREAHISFDEPAVSGTLPPKDVGGDAPATPLAVKINDDLTLNVEVKRSGESQPLADDEEVDSGVFYGKLDGYGDDVQNVVVVKGKDGTVVTEIKDFRNGMVYKTVTKDGHTETFTTYIQPQPFDETHPHERLLSSSEQLSSALPSRRLLADFDRSGNVSGAVYVDLLVAYDLASANFVVNQGGITNFALTAVAKMNLALANSGLDEKFRVRLLGVLPVAADAEGDMDKVLDDVVDKKGAWAAVAAERDRVGADLVSILVDTGSAYGWTGLGYSLKGDTSKFKNYGFNACAVRSVAISDTLTHEVGHNMGAGHADKDHMANEFGPQYEACSSGYYFVADSVDYHTIMAYDTDKNYKHYRPAPFFSTPGKSYQGVNVGDGSHDNVSTIVKTYLAISNFRSPSTDVIPEPIPEEPTVPDTPIDPTNPDMPTNPTDPGTPTNPTDPGTPTDPTNPDIPTNPTDPGTPANPTDPGTPTNPTDPDTPANPTGPGTPANPTGPGTPTDPTDPDSPANPANPVTPTENPTDPASPNPPPGTPAVDPMALDVVSVESIVSGVFVGRSSTFAGCTLDAARHPLGLFELKLGKTNSSTGLCKITGSYTPIGGKKITLKPVEKKGVSLLNGPATANFLLKGVGELTIVIGMDATDKLVFAGRLGDQVVTSVDMPIPSGEKRFAIDSLPEVLDGVVVNGDYLPTSANGGEVVNMDGKWTCAKAMSIKYKKINGALLPSWVENNGNVFTDKTNRSGLKLTYNAKKGTFKGSFVVYGLANGRLKKLKFTVSGIVVAGKVFGVATYKKVNYSCSVK